MEHIWVTEVSFGRTKSAKKLVKGVARFWSSARLKLPLTIRGLQIELREGNELPAWAVRCALSKFQHAPLQVHREPGGLDKAAPLQLEVPGLWRLGWLA